MLRYEASLERSFDSHAEPARAPSADAAGPASPAQIRGAPVFVLRDKPKRKAREELGAPRHAFFDVQAYRLLQSINWASSRSLTGRLFLAASRFWMSIFTKRQGRISGSMRPSLCNYGGRSRILHAIPICGSTGRGSGRGCEEIAQVPRGSRNASQASGRQHCI